MTEKNLGTYGPIFQIKVLYAILNEKVFLQNIADVLTSDYFESPAHKWIVDLVISYYAKYHTNPTMEVVKVELKKLKNDILKIAVKEELRKAYTTTADDIEYIKEEFSSFCRNQLIKEALLQSVDLLDAGAFDDIHRVMSTALKAGEAQDDTHDYDKDVESRYRDDDRKVLPFPWPTFNKHTQGGFGGKDLVLIFGNPKGGKSWAAVAIGGNLADLGYNVLHYTLELGAGYVGKRYDAFLTGIPVDKLHLHREQVDARINGLSGKIKIKAYSPKRASLDTIENHIRTLKTKEGFVPDVIIIDYLDLLKTTRLRKDRKEEIDDIFTEAKGLAADIDIPIISPCQANRAGANSEILEGIHIGGSYEKIMIGDIVVSLARRRQERKNGTGKWHFMGNRYGPDGMTFDSKIDTSNGHIQINDEEWNDEDSTTDDILKDEDVKKKMRQKFDLLEQ